MNFFSKAQVSIIVSTVNCGNEMKNKYPRSERPNKLKVIYHNIYSVLLVFNITVAADIDPN